MKDRIHYKGYEGSAHYSDEDAIFYGKVEFIRSHIGYEGRDVRSWRASFEEAVDDYLKFCEEKGQKPDEAFKGSFNVRWGQDLHRKAALFAKDHSQTLNDVMKTALEKYLSCWEGWERIHSALHSAQELREFVERI